MNSFTRALLTYKKATLLRWFYPWFIFFFFLENKFTSPEQLLYLAGAFTLINVLISILYLYFRNSYSVFTIKIHSFINISVDFSFVAVTAFITGSVLPLYIFIPIILYSGEVGGKRLSNTVLILSVLASGTLAFLDNYTFLIKPFDVSSLATDISIFSDHLFFLFILIITSVWAREKRGALAASDLPFEDEPELKRVKELEGLNKKLKEQASDLAAKDFQLTMANKRLKQLEDAKSKFISVTAHQMRTPLSAIKWTFDMILKERLGPVSGEQKTFLDKGFKSTQRMISIVNELLNTDLAEQGSDVYNFVFVNPIELLDSVIYEFSNQAESKEITLTFDRPMKTLPDIEVDPSKMRIVLENVIDNAVKYTKRGGKVNIFINDERVNSSARGLEIIVSDSGIGIPISEQKKIFSQFFRAGNAISFEPDGSGIGLYLARDIVDKHSGTLWFESEEGKGTSFHILLPLEQPKK